MQWGRVCLLGAVLLLRQSSAFWYVDNRTSQSLEGWLTLHRFPQSTVPSKVSFIFSGYSVLLTISLAHSVICM